MEDMRGASRGGTGQQRLLNEESDNYPRSEDYFGKKAKTDSRRIE